MNARKRNGFSSVEMIVAAAILCVGLIPVVASIWKLSVGVTDRIEERVTLLLAQSFLENIRQKKWDEATSNANPGVLVTPSALGLDAGEALPATGIDDIDDYNGYVDTSIPGYKRTVTVQYVTAPWGGAVTVSGAATDFKLIRVTAMKLLPPAKSSTVETIVCNGVVN